MFGGGRVLDACMYFGACCRHNVPSLLRATKEFVTIKMSIVLYSSVITRVEQFKQMKEILREFAKTQPLLGETYQNVRVFIQGCVQRLRDTHANWHMAYLPCEQTGHKACENSTGATSSGYDRGG